MKRSSYLVMGLFLVSLSTAQQGRQDPSRQSATVDPLAAAAAASINRFGSSLYGALSGSDGNLFLSPYSVAVALAMARSGAVGLTAAQMDEVLGTAGLALPAAHRRLREQLAPGRVRIPGAESGQPPVAAFELAIAQRLFVQEGLSLSDDFLAVQREDFAAPLARLDFRATEAARRTINDWVADRTGNRIQDIVPAGLPAPDTLLALANAIHFKAAWAGEFQPRLTKAGEFTTLDGERRDVELMQRTHHWRYAETERAQILELPYLGGECAMWIVLPTNPPDFAEVEAGLTVEALAQLEARLAPRMVALQLPKFTITATFELGSALRSLGMRVPFDAVNADFTGITRDEPLVIGPVLHKAFVAVDEAGTEAAAATVVLMLRGTAVRPEEPVEFIADRPFWFAIRHQRSGSLLFLGRLMDPAA